MRQLVPGMVKGVLKVLFVEPPVPHSESPVSYDSGVSFEGRVERAAGAIDRKEGKDRVASRGGGGSRRGDFHSGVVQTGVRDAKGSTSIHDSGDRSGASHESGVDAGFPESFVPLHATTEIAESLPEPSGID